MSALTAASHTLKVQHANILILLKCMDVETFLTNFRQYFFKISKYHENIIEKHQDFVTMMVIFLQSTWSFLFRVYIRT